MNGSTVGECTCKHEFQDRHYGKGKRLKNYGAKVIRCTVCGKETPIEPGKKNEGE